MKKLKRMISYSFCVLLAICLISCAGIDEYGCYESVNNAFPEAIEIRRPIGEKWIFIVVDADSSVYYIETMNQNDVEITQKELIHKW